MLYRRLYQIIASSFILASALHTVSAQAIPFNSAIHINGTVSLDTINSTLPSGIAGIVGSISITTAGTYNGTLFEFFTETSSNPITQALTDIDDNLAIHFLVAGAFNDRPMQQILFGDYTLVLSNSSVTDTFEIVLGVSVVQNVDATGPDAFVIGELRIEDPLNNPVVFANHTRDTLNGPSDSPLSPESFSIVLAPGASIQYDGLLSLRAGAFEIDSFYYAQLGAQISVASVRNITQPPEPVPEPGTYLLMALGLGALVTRRSRV